MFFQLQNEYHYLLIATPLLLACLFSYRMNIRMQSSKGCFVIDMDELMLFEPVIYKRDEFACYS